MVRLRRLLKTLVLVAGLSMLQATLNAPATADDKNAPHPKADDSLPQRPLTVLYKTDTRIYFGKGTARPRPDSLPRIDAVAAMLREWPNHAFIVWGHADPEEAADEEAALNLGLQRAIAVRELPVERGVARRALAVSSRGYRAFMPLNREERTLSARRYVSVEEVMPR